MKLSLEPYISHSVCSPISLKVFVNQSSTTTNLPNDEADSSSRDDPRIFFGREVIDDLTNVYLNSKIIKITMLIKFQVCSVYFIPTQRSF